MGLAARVLIRLLIFHPPPSLIAVHSLGIPLRLAPNPSQQVQCLLKHSPCSKSSTLPFQALLYSSNVNKLKVEHSYYKTYSSQTVKEILACIGINKAITTAFLSANITCMFRIVLSHHAFVIRVISFPCACGLFFILLVLLTLGN